MTCEDGAVVEVESLAVSFLAFRATYYFKSSARVLALAEL